MFRARAQNSLQENAVNAFFPTGRQVPQRKPENVQVEVKRKGRNEAVYKAQFLCPTAASQGRNGSHTCRNQNREPQKTLYTGVKKPWIFIQHYYLLTRLVWATHIIDGLILLPVKQTEYLPNSTGIYQKAYVKQHLYVHSLPFPVTSTEKSIF